MQCAKLARTRPPTRMAESGLTKLVSARMTGILQNPLDSLNALSIKYYRFATPLGPINPATRAVLLRRTGSEDTWALVTWLKATRAQDTDISLKTLGGERCSTDLPTGALIPLADAFSGLLW